MKKLMIALVAAAAAFGLRAADAGFISGSDFEIENLDATLWTAADGTATLTEGSHDVEAVKRPTQWKFSNNATNLSIKTTLGSPVTQKIQPEGTKLIGTGVYFDGLVNLTVFDVDDNPPATDLEGAKLGVYLQLANEDESETNLVVVAQGNDDAKAYVCADADLTPGWHRLTIKAIANIYNEGVAATNAGFVVFVDNNAVSCTSIEGITAADLTPNAKLFYDNGRLFASLGGADASLTSIQYDGQGIIDEVAFTTVAPFDAAKDSDFVLVTWTAENVTEMTIGGEKFTGGSAYAKITYDGDDVQPIEVSWKGADGYIDGSYTIEEPSKDTPVDLDSEIKPAVATFDDDETVTKFATIKDAVGAAALADGTIKLLTDVGEEEAIEFASEKSIVLDFNGCTAYDVTGEAATLIYDNSSETMAVVEGSADAEATLVTTNIKFSYEKNNIGGLCSVGAEPPDDYVFVRVGGYWELKEEQTAIDIATCTIADVTAVYGTAVTDLVITDEANVKTLAKDTDYTLNFNGYTAETAAGTEVTVTVTGINDYKGTTTKTFTVAAKTVTPTITFDPDVEEATWSKGGSLPEVTVVAEGTEGVDYTAGWAIGVLYPEENPDEPVVFTYTVTMQGNYTGSASKTFTVKPAEEEPVVVPGGAPVVVTREEAEKLVIKATSPDAGVISDADYSKYFKKQIVDVGEGNVSVTAVLDEEAIEFAESAADLGEQIGAIAAGEGEATIAAKPGLYYYVEEANDVTKIAEPERDRVMATGDEVTVPTTKFENSGFYRLNVSTVQRGIVTGQ